MTQNTVFIVPAFNESISSLNQVINSIMDFGYDILLVDDGSEIDYTPITPTEYIRLDTNSGQGNALNVGMKWALANGYKYCVHFDGDGQHDIKDAFKMLEEIRRMDLDIVLGSRFLSGENKIDPIRKIMLKTGIVINYVLCGIKLTDSNNGLRVLNEKAMLCADLKSKRMAHASEIIWLIKKYQLKYSEFPVHISYSDYSITKGQKLYSAIGVFLEIIKIYWMNYRKNI
jgi:glycosyltransferase involved in cell wall biosynthesis